MYTKYKRTNIAEMRPVTKDEAESQTLPSDISVSQSDRISGSPKIGDMVARNPEDFTDKWLVAKRYFEDNFEKV